MYIYINYIKTRHSLICTWDHNDSCYSKLGPCMNTFQWHTQKVTTRVFSLHISLAINVVDIFHSTQVLEQGSQYHRLCMGQGHSPARHIVGTGAHHLWPHLSLTRNAHFVLCTQELFKAHHRGPYLAHKEFLWAVAWLMYCCIVFQS